MPTVGFNLETVTYRNITFMMWDIGGQEKVLTLYPAPLIFEC